MQAARAEADDFPQAFASPRRGRASSTGRALRMGSTPTSARRGPSPRSNVSGSAPFLLRLGISRDTHAMCLVRPSETRYSQRAFHPAKRRVMGQSRAVETPVYPVATGKRGTSTVRESVPPVLSNRGCSIAFARPSASGTIADEPKRRMSPGSRGISPSTAMASRRAERP
jgi:hypothetical protein